MIMGCGRVGSELAHRLEARALRGRHRPEPGGVPAARPDFRGRRVTGIGFDRDGATRPASSEAHAFAAVSSGDNSNIISARVARETFGVENVVARIYDPRRAEVYQRLGIPTVATVAWTADQMIRRLLPGGKPSRCGATRREPYGSPRCTSAPAGSGSALEPRGGGIRRPGGVPHPVRRGPAAR